MSTYTNNLIAEHGMLVRFGFGRIATVKGYKAATTTKAVETLVKHVRNVALFFAAPFIGLAYLLAFPVIGLGMLAWIAAKAIMKNEKARFIALALAAPVAALAFVTVGPIVAMGALVAIGAKAALKA